MRLRPIEMIMMTIMMTMTLFNTTYIHGLASTLPVNQAGHQTHPMTTCVHSPFTFHPNAASARISPTPMPLTQVAIHKTTGGDNSCRITVEITLRDIGCNVMLDPSSGE